MFKQKKIDPDIMRSQRAIFAALLQEHVKVLEDRILDYIADGFFSKLKREKVALWRKQYKAKIAAYKKEFKNAPV